MKTTITKSESVMRKLNLVILVVGLCFSQTILAIEGRLPRRPPVKKRSGSSHTSSLHEIALPKGPPPKLPSLDTKPARGKPVVKKRSPPPLPPGMTYEEANEHFKKKMAGEMEKNRAMFGLSKKPSSGSHELQRAQSKPANHSTFDGRTNEVKKASYLQKSPLEMPRGSRISLPSNYDQMSIAEKKKYHQDQIQSQNEMQMKTRFENKNTEDVQERSAIVAEHLRRIADLQNSSNPNQKKSIFKMPNLFKKQAVSVEH